MAYLFDTNVFLEILLNQEKKGVCKKLLVDNIGNIYISDFTLHSIGVILFKQKKSKIFELFLNDILPNATILSLPKSKYTEIISITAKYKMDFDDSYQALIAIEFDLVVKTMDKDFTRIGKIVQVDIF